MLHGASFSAHPAPRQPPTPALNAKHARPIPLDAAVRRPPADPGARAGRRGDATTIVERRATTTHRRRVSCERMTRWRQALVGLIAGAAFAAPPAAHAAPTLTPSVVGEAPVAAGGVFRFPQAVAFSPGGAVVYVGDQYSGVVQSFGRDGTPRATFGSRGIRREPGRLGTVGGVATDKDGRVYVLDSENDRVQIFTPAGSLIASWGDSTIFDLATNPASVTAGISASGMTVAQSAAGAAPVVYVAEQGRNRVGRFVLDPATLQPTAQTFTDPATLTL